MVADRRVVQIDGSIISKLLLQNCKRIGDRLNDDQLFRTNTVEQHPGPLANIRANIDDVTQICGVPGWEKSRAAYVGLSRQPVARKYFLCGKPSTCISQFSPVANEIDDPVGQNKF